jgi:membrane fusion protein, multidrug efflux system
VKRRPFVLPAVVVVAVAALVWGGYLWWRARHTVTTDDAYVDGTVAPVSAKVAGQVIEVLVRDNEQVKAGQVIMRLDARDYRAKLEQARAAVLIAERRHYAAVERVGLGREMASSQHTQALAATIRGDAARASAAALVDAARATVDARRAALASFAADRDRAVAMRDRAAQDLARATELFRKDLVAREFVDHAEADGRAADAVAVSAEQRVAQARRDLESAEADARTREEGFDPTQLGTRLAEARTVDASAAHLQAKALLQEVRVRAAEQDLAEAQLREAQANLQVAALNLEYTEVRSPLDGVVSKKAVEPGQVVQPGQPVLAVAALHDIWIIANYKETQLRGVRPGMRTDIYVDTYSGQLFHGVVDSIAAGTGSRFSLLPAENATGNWVKVVQRVPVKVVLDEKVLAGNPHTLRNGMSAVVTIHLH